ncbi:MAG: 2TM domain-containing protein [Alkalispirochaeta sp.]
MDHTDYRLAAILYVDIVGFRTMMAADERAALELLSESTRRVTAVAERYHGTVIKTDGDRLLLDFPTTAEAYRCAGAILSAIGELGPVPGESAGSRLRARIGLHVGDVFFRENDALGNGIEIVRALTDIARPGHVVASGDVYNQIRDKLDGTAAIDVGPQEIAPLYQRVSAYELDVLDLRAGPRRPRGGDEPLGAGGASNAASPPGEAPDRHHTERDHSGVGFEEDYRRLRRLVLDSIRTRAARPDQARLPAQIGLAEEPSPVLVARLVEEGLVRPTEAEDEPAWSTRSQSTGREDRPKEHRHDPRSDLQFDPAQALGDVVRRGLKRILRTSGGSDADVAAAYRTEFERRMKAERAGLAGHTTAYIGVNTLLVGLWAWSGVSFPWFLIPALGWGIGYVSHRVTVKSRERELEQVQAARNPTRHQLQLHRRLWKIRRRFRGHLASNGMTMALLGTINIITQTPFPWALIPIGFMGVGLVAHWRKSRDEEEEVLQQLEASGFAPVGSRGADRRWSVSADFGTESPAAEAKAIRGELLKELRSMKEAERPVGNDVKNVLDTYVDQIEALTTALREVDALIAGIPISELEADRRRLEEQLAQCSDSRLAEEYRRSIQQIDTQRQSYSELKAEREMLALRANTAVGALKQLKIDVVRARSSRGRVAQSSLDDLRARSTDLSRYLSDLREAYEELE